MSGKQKGNDEDDEGKITLKFGMMLLDVPAFSFYMIYQNCDIFQKSPKPNSKYHLTKLIYLHQRDRLLIKDVYACLKF